MTVKIAAVTLDCVDALVVGRFWSAALGRQLDPKASSEHAAIGFAGRRTVRGWTPTAGGADPTWLFVKVPEAKVAKNRLHLDVTAPDVDVEVARLVALGATRVADMEEYGYTWTVMTDPEANEFCVAREA